MFHHSSYKITIDLQWPWRIKHPAFFAGEPAYRDLYAQAGFPPALGLPMGQIDSMPTPSIITLATYRQATLSIPSPGKPDEVEVLENPRVSEWHLVKRFIL